MTEIILIAIVLAMDAFTVAAIGGAITKKIKVFNVLKMACFFGLFQSLMPFIGWLAGMKLKNLITYSDHWLAFGLLGFIGGKMIYEGLKNKSTHSTSLRVNFFSNKVLFGLAIATSIDALAVGITFAFIKTDITTPVVIIGAITFFLTFTGVYIGQKFDGLLSRRAGIFGGLVLILIGLKILIEHLVK